MNPYGVYALFSAALGIRADDPDAGWRDEALCAQSDPDAWFPEKGGPTRQVKAICRRCPSRVPCLRLALNSAAEYGIWSGLGREERETAAREYRQGVSLEAIIDAADEAWEARQAAVMEQARSSAAKAAAASARAAKAERAAWLAESSSVPQLKAAS